jgi:hypothetical protein
MSTIITNNFSKTKFIFKIYFLCQTFHQYLKVPQEEKRPYTAAIR